MEIKETVNHSENLKQGMVKRVMLMVFGCIASLAVIALLPLLYLVPTTVEVSTRSRPATDHVLIGAVVPPILLLMMVGLILYGIYDTARLYMRYRKSRQDEQQMFP